MTSIKTLTETNNYWQKATTVTTGQRNKQQQTAILQQESKPILKY
jgi:hypothetical protein